MTMRLSRTETCTMGLICVQALWIVGCQSEKFVPPPPISAKSDEVEPNPSNKPAPAVPTRPRPAPIPPTPPKSTTQVVAIPAPSAPIASPSASESPNPRPSPKPETPTAKSGGQGADGGGTGSGGSGGGSRGSGGGGGSGVAAGAGGGSEKGTGKDSGKGTGKDSGAGASGGASGSEGGGASGTNPTTPPAGTQSKSEGEVDLSEKDKTSPNVFDEEPVPPPGTTAPPPPSKPTVPPPADPAGGEALDFGEVAPTTAPIPVAKPTDSKEEVATLVLPFRGAWRQQDTSQSNHADYSPGGYSARYLLFNEGMGEMRVYSGFGSPVKQVVAMRYRFLSKGDGRISIEPFPGAAASLDLMPVGAVPPRSMSETTTWSLGSDGTTMTLGGKIYVRASAAECEAFATGDKQRPTRPPAEPPTLAGLPWESGDTLVIVDSGQSNEKRGETLGALRVALREQSRQRRVLVVGPKSTVPMKWEDPGTEMILLQVANAEASGSSPLSPSRLGDLLRSVPSTPNRVAIVAGGGITPSDLKDILTKRGWKCPVDVVLNDERDADSWRALAAETGGRVRPE